MREPEWLLQSAHHSRVAVGAIGTRKRRCDDDHGDPGTADVVRERPHEVRTGHFRHEYVRYDQAHRRLVPHEGMQRFTPVARLHDAVALPFERIANAYAEVEIILCHEDAAPSKLVALD